MPGSRHVPRSRHVQRTASRLLAAVMIVLGLAMLAVTVGGGGGPFAVGVLLGALFVAAGTGRLWLERPGGRQR